MELAACHTSGPRCPCLCRFLVLVLQQGGKGGGARPSSAQKAASAAAAAAGGGGAAGGGADGLLFWSPRWKPTGQEGENYYLGVVPK